MKADRRKLGAALATLWIAALAQAQIRTVWDTFEHRSNIDAGNTANHQQILDEARRAVLDEFGQEWLAQPGTPAERRARCAALEIARRTPGEYVTLQIKHGPFVRPGTRGYVSARAEVRLGALRQLVARRLKSAKPAPRYKVLVLISEYKVVGVPRYVRERNEISKAATAIEGVLAQAGWTVVNERQLEVIRERDLDYAHLDQDSERLIARIAKEQGAEIIIRGSVKVEGPRTRILDGQQMHYFSADLTIVATWADTGDVLFTVPKPTDQRTSGTREAGLNGAERTLEIVAEDVAEYCARQLSLLDSRSGLSITVKNVESLDQEIQIRRWIQSIAGAEGVGEPQISGGRWTLEVVTQLSAYEFAVRLHELCGNSDAEFTLKQVSRSVNRIEYALEAR